MIYKKFISKICAGALSLILLTPALAFANEQGARDKDRAAKAEGVPMFCANVDAIAKKMSRNYSEKEVKFQEKKNEREQKLEKNRAEREQHQIQNRNKWDENRALNFDKLLAKATTDEQKAAVATFKTTMTNAIDARRKAVDAAIATFQAGVDKIIADRKAVVDPALVTLKAAVDGAVIKAKADCAANVDPKIVRDAFEKAIKDAQAVFKAATVKVTGPDALNLLKTTRDQALKKAQDDFASARDAAVKALKAAFPEATTK